MKINQEKIGSYILAAAIVLLIIAVVFLIKWSVWGG